MNIFVKNASAVSALPAISMTAAARPGAQQVSPEQNKIYSGLLQSICMLRI
jgi:hypothetical protein